MKLNEKEKIEGSIEVKTGMHIGGMKETFQIGGQDSPVIKIRTGEYELPYIPGSSLKGKIRCLLERKEGLNEPCGCGTCNVCKLFGSHRPDKAKGEKERQASVIFRDALLENTEIYKENGKLKNNRLFETKAENTIDRVTGTTIRGGLRFTERVLPGARFKLEIIYNKCEGEDDKHLLETLKEGFELLADDYIGGSGSRGYGRIDVSSVIEKLEKAIQKSEDK